MLRYSFAFILAAASGLLLAAPANAQKRCPEGKTISGECVNASLAEAMRKEVLFMTQPKFSYTAPAQLPIEDRDNFNPLDHHEYSNFFLFPFGPRVDSNKP